MAFNIDTEGAALNNNNQMQQRVHVVADSINESVTQDKSNKYRTKFCIISFGLVLVALIQIIYIIITIIGYNKLSNQHNSIQFQIDNLQQQTDEIAKNYFNSQQFETNVENNTFQFNPEIYQIRLSEIEKQITDTHHDLQTQINQILADTQNITQTLALIQNDINVVYIQNQIVKNLTRNIKDLQTKHDLSITQLQSQLDNISIENTNLNSKYVTLQNKDDSLQTQITSIGSDINSLWSSLSANVNDINNQITVINTNPSQLTDNIVIGSSWYFYNQYGLIASITLQTNGGISGFNDANVQTWKLSAAGILEFYNPSQQRSIEFIFNVLDKNGKWKLLGPIYAGDIHYLQQI